MKNLLPLMDEIEETNIADKLHLQARLSLVSYLPLEERNMGLKEIYGENFRRAEAFPLPESKAISKVLSQRELKKTDNPIIIEEYRRLERTLDYSRKTFCLDLEGLIINNGKLTPKIEQSISKIRKRHGIVISTAAPEKEAQEILELVNFKIPILIFGNLKGRGKRYSPIAEFFGYHHPEENLIAVGHSFEDTPADLNIPFIYLDVTHNSMAEALNSSVNFIDKKQYNFKIKAKKLNLGNRSITTYLVSR